MTTLAWFGLVALTLIGALIALIATVALSRVEGLQRENDRLREKCFRLDREKRELEERHLVGIGMEVVRGILDEDESLERSCEDPATILDFPHEHAQRLRNPGRRS
jgi:uncharacterized membrane-anchored protein YhcB (DUF1043 family)